MGSLGFTATFLLLLLLQDSPTPFLLYVMIAAQGALGYGITSVIGAIPAEIFQGRHYGAIFGTLMLASIGGGAAGPWLTGALHDATGSYTIAFWIAIGCSLMSAIAIWLAAPRKVRLVAGRVPAPADPESYSCPGIRGDQNPTRSPPFNLRISRASLGVAISRLSSSRMRRIFVTCSAFDFASAPRPI